MSTPGAARAVLLDRDGTLTVEGEWITRRQDLVLVPGAADALARLAAAGWKLVLVTNQSAIARGLITRADLAEIHAELQQQLGAHGARLDAIYYCPHHPTEGHGEFTRECECRKPKPGLVLQAARELGLDLGACWMVGDAARDLEAGWAAGVPGILVATGKGASEIGKLRASGRAPAAFVADLPAAADWILARAQGK
ncbi:MAG: HAD family hydrolase [Planctomycetes bacterium]|nr:HAD family hydrolase [Planctomycetota bacterium]